MSWLSNALESVTRLFRWWVVVAPWERCLRVRGGKRAAVLGPGIHLRVPLLDRLLLVCIRRRIVDGPVQTLSTRDGVVYVVKLTASYEIADAGALLQAVARPEETLLNAAQGAAARHVATTRSEDLTPVTLRDAVQRDLGREVEGWGLGEPAAEVVGFARVRTYRVVGDERGRSWSGFDDMLDDTNRMREAAK